MGTYKKSKIKPQSIMLMKSIEHYDSPQAEILGLYTEGVLCASGDDPQDGSGLFDSPDYKDGEFLDIF